MIWCCTFVVVLPAKVGGARFEAAPVAVDRFAVTETP
jgi:hypothetical protein